MAQLADTEAALRAILDAPRRAHRRLVALVGGPGSGKSTLSAALAKGLAAHGVSACVVPMDGFHLDNRILDARGLRTRKGAPETFDVAGFTALLTRAAGPEEVFHPVFERARDCALASAGRIAPTCDTVIVEGNYLLLNMPGWSDLEHLWDISISLTPSVDVLRARLMERWLDLGLTHDEARIKTESNDLPNARLIAEHSVAADFELVT